MLSSVEIKKGAAKEGRGVRDCDQGAYSEEEGSYIKDKVTG